MFMGFREEGAHKERENDRETFMGMCCDRELNLQPLGVWGRRYNQLRRSARASCVLFLRKRNLSPSSSVYFLLDRMVSGLICFQQEEHGHLDWLNFIKTQPV